jgi:hypothetical protein
VNVEYLPKPPSQPPPANSKPLRPHRPWSAPMQTSSKVTGGSSSTSMPETEHTPSAHPSPSLPVSSPMNERLEETVRKGVLPPLRRDLSFAAYRVALARARSKMNMDSKSPSDKWSEH